MDGSMDLEQPGLVWCWVCSLLLKELEFYRIKEILRSQFLEKRFLSLKVKFDLFEFFIVCVINLDIVSSSR